MPDVIRPGGYKTPRSVIALPYADLGDGNAYLDLDACYWAGFNSSGDEVWVSPSLSTLARGFSSGNVQDNGNGTVTFFGDV